MNLTDLQWDEIVEVFCFTNEQTRNLKTALQTVLKIELPRRASVVPICLGSTEIVALRGLVAAYFKMRVADMLSPKKYRHSAEPRFVVMWLLRHRREWDPGSPPMCLREIAAAVARYNHTSALHGIREVDRSPRLLAIAKSLLRDLSAQRLPLDSAPGTGVQS